MHELPKVSENYNHNLPKASKMIITDNFELTNAKSLAQSLSASNLLYFLAKLKTGVEIREICIAG